MISQAFYPHQSGLDANTLGTFLPKRAARSTPDKARRKLAEITQYTRHTQGRQAGAALEEVMAAISAMPHRAFDLSYPGPASALAGARDRGSTLVRQDRARLSKPTPSQRVSARGRGSVAVRSSIDDIPDEIPEELIPDALKGLVLNEDGDLVDTKTGKVLNEFGATRFDVAVRAMRGEYDPIGASTEHEEGQIMDTITQFPTDYTFQVSGRKEDLGQDSALNDLCSVIGHACGCEISRETQVEIKERGSSGKFLSVWVTCRVYSAFMVNETLRQVKEDERVMMAC